MLSIREKFKAGNSLTCLLHALIGRVTTVELRNESFARGRIVNVDGFMNVQMTGVFFTSQSGKNSRMDHFFVQGQQIRYVQIPDDVNIVSAMQHEVAMMGFAERGRGRGRGRGGGRGQTRRTFKPPTKRTEQA